MCETAFIIMSLVTMGIMFSAAILAIIADKK